MKLDANGNPIADDNQDNKGTPGATPEEIQAQVSALVAEQLKSIKANLDNAYAARDEAIRKAAALEASQEAARLEQLTKEGKHSEVAAAKITALEEKLRLATEQNTRLTRDSMVNQSINGLAFRNERSQAMAYNAIVSELVQDSEGNWVHKTGVSIKDFVANFAKDDDNSFLFAPKNNSGSGSSGSGGTPNLDLKKKPSEMTTQEILAAAQAGKLGKFNG